MKEIDSSNPFLSANLNPAERGFMFYVYIIYSPKADCCCTINLPISVNYQLSTNQFSQTETLSPKNVSIL